MDRIQVLSYNRSLTREDGLATGLLALLDDVSALVKASAASLDDIPAQVAKTTSKVSGIVIDDAAVTPKYVVGLDPSRELAIIFRIAQSSLINKLLILGPVTLLLGFYAPWSITPILMLGGCFLCFEGYEKVHTMIFGKSKDKSNEESLEEISPEELEKMRVSSAVRTDFILSAEIMAITYSTVAKTELINQVVVMACVAMLITFVVYGFVGFLVKIDDVGLYFARKKESPLQKKFGKFLVKLMPILLAFLSYLGTFAMLLVGGEIIAHGIPVLHHGLEHIPELVSNHAVAAKLLQVLACVFGGLIIGGIVEKIVHLIPKKSENSTTQ